MAALTAARNTQMKGDDGTLVTLPVAASTTIFAGSLVGQDASGNAVPAGSTNSIKVIGRMERVLNGIPGASAVNVANADCPPNPPNLGSAGAISVDIRRKGPMSFDINSSDITVVNMGQMSYAVDDHTVSSSSNGGARNPAGRILSLNGDIAGQVYIDCSDQGSVAERYLASAAGVAAAGPVTVAGTKVGQRVLAVWGTLTAGGPPVVKLPGTDFESTISVAGQVQQLTATDLHLYTFVFEVGPAAV